MTAFQIAGKLKEWNFDYEICGDPTVDITGFSDPADYMPQTAIWIGKAEDVVLGENLTAEDIALIFAKPESGVEKIFPNVILTSNPKLAFMKLVYETYSEPMTEKISPFAIIDESAKIGKNCLIARNAIIGKNAVIGDGCQIYENVYIGDNCVIGSNCVIGQGALIGSENNGSSFTDLDGIMKNMPNVGNVVIGNYVLIGANSIISRGTFHTTFIGDECMLNAGTAVGHNCRIGRKTMLLGRCTIAGNTRIGENCQVISACIKNRITIGNNVKVNIGSVVIKNIEDNKTVTGNPARIIPG